MHSITDNIIVGVYHYDRMTDEIRRWFNCCRKKNLRYRQNERRKGGISTDAGKSMKPSTTRARMCVPSIVSNRYKCEREREEKPRSLI